MITICSRPASAINRWYNFAAVMLSLSAPLLAANLYVQYFVEQFVLYILLLAREDERRGEERREEEEESFQMHDANLHHLAPELYSWGEAASERVCFEVQFSPKAPI